MTKQIFKSILIGVLLGAAFFVMPFFLFQFLVFFMLMGLILRLTFGRHRRHHWHPAWQFAHADKIRGMSDEEYSAYKNDMKQKFQGHCCHHGYHSWHKPSDKETKNTSNE